MKFSSAIIICFALSVFSACEPSDGLSNTQGSCSSGKCDSPSTETFRAISLKGLVKCWIEPQKEQRFDVGNELYCHVDHSRIPAPILIGSVAVTLRSDLMPDDLQHFKIERTDFGSDVRLGTLYGEAFPITIQIDLTFDTEDDFAYRNWGKVRVKRSGNLTKFSLKTPLVLDAPFDLWPIKFIPKNNRLGKVSYYNGFQQSMIASVDPDDMKGQVFSFTSYIDARYYPDFDKLRHLPAWRNRITGDSSEVHGDFTFGNLQRSRISMRAPGYYTIDENGKVAPSTSREIRNFRSGLYGDGSHSLR